MSTEAWRRLPKRLPHLSFASSRVRLRERLTAIYQHHVLMFNCARIICVIDFEHEHATRKCSKFYAKSSQDGIDIKFIKDNVPSCNFSKLLLCISSFSCKQFCYTFSWPKFLRFRKRGSAYFKKKASMQTNYYVTKKLWSDEAHHRFVQTLFWPRCRGRFLPILAEPAT